MLLEKGSYGNYLFPTYVRVEEGVGPEDPAEAVDPSLALVGRVLRERPAAGEGSITEWITLLLA